MNSLVYTHHHHHNPHTHWLDSTKGRCAENHHLGFIAALHWEICQEILQECLKNIALSNKALLQIPAVYGIHWINSRVWNTTLLLNPNTISKHFFEKVPIQCILKSNIMLISYIQKNWLEWHCFFCCCCWCYYYDFCNVFMFWYSYLLWYYTIQLNQALV